MLVVDNHLQAFDSLEEKLKEQVFGFKIDLSGDNMFYGQVYCYRLNPSLATGSFYPGQTFGNVLERLMTEERVLGPALVDILRTLDAEYSYYYFMKTSGT